MAESIAAQLAKIQSSPLAENEPALKTLSEQARQKRNKLFRNSEMARDQLDETLESMGELGKVSGKLEGAYISKIREMEREIASLRDELLTRACENQRLRRQLGEREVIRNRVTESRPNRVTFADVTVTNGEIKINSNNEKNSAQARTGQITMPPLIDASPNRSAPVRVELPREIPPSQRPEQERTVCFNCRQRGHRYRDCPEGLKLFCRGCGCPGFKRPNCPNKCPWKFGSLLKPNV